MQNSIYSKFFTSKTEEQLTEVLFNENDPLEMRVAALQEIRNRDPQKQFADGFEQRLMLDYAGKQEKSREVIKQYDASERELPTAIKRAVYLLLSTVFMHILFYIIMKNTYDMNMLANPVYLTGFILRSGFIFLICIFLYQGRKWPRIVSLILFLLSTISIGAVYFNVIRNTPHMNSYLIIYCFYVISQVALMGVSQLLLFSPAMNRWYKGEERSENTFILDQI